MLGYLFVFLCFSNALWAEGVTMSNDRKERAVWTEEQYSEFVSYMLGLQNTPEPHYLEDVAEHFDMRDKDGNPDPKQVRTRCQTIKSKTGGRLDLAEGLTSKTDGRKKISDDFWASLGASNGEKAPESKSKAKSK